jgi:hypothetical protein
MPKIYNYYKHKRAQILLAGGMGAECNYVYII